MTLFRPNQLVRPSSLSEAVRVLSNGDGKARLVAGNTTLYDLAQHSGLDDVETLVDISGLGLDYVRENDDGSALEVGAATTFSELEIYKPPSGAKGLDALFETAAKITPPQVRNMGTIGGAVCTGIPFLDMTTTVLALNAKLNAISDREERSIMAGDHFVDYFQTAVQPDEIVTSIEFPFSSVRAGSAFIKLGRTAVDFAVVNVTSFLNLDESGRCEEARVALGAVANTPIRWKAAEEKLLGKVLDRNLIAETMNEIKVDFEPSPTLGAPAEYKKLVIPKLVRDSLLTSYDRAMKVEI